MSLFSLKGVEGATGEGMNCEVLPVFVSLSFNGKPGGRMEGGNPETCISFVGSRVDCELTRLRGCDDEVGSRVDCELTRLNPALSFLGANQSALLNIS